MQRHAPGVDRRNTRRRSDYQPLGGFSFNLEQECGFACAGPACEKNVLARIAHVFECKVELGIGNETHLLKFATRSASSTDLPAQYNRAHAIYKTRVFTECRARRGLQRDIR